MIPLYKFYNTVIARANRGPERQGQAAFNYLFELRPELANEIRGTDKDPFYVEKLSDPKWDNFVTYIESVWYQ